MKNFKKLLSMLLIFISVMFLAPVQANAAWESGSNGWWYSQGNSYATGWTQIGGQWYYFDDNGYMKTGWLSDNGNWYYLYGEGTMAHDTTVDGYYLNSKGAWTTDIPKVTNNNNNNLVSNGEKLYVNANGQGTIKGSKNHIYHVPGSTYYDRTTNVVQWFKTVGEAQAAGYRAPEK